MKREQWIVMATGLALIGATAVYLTGVRHKQRLGEPGLQMVQEPVLDETGRVVGTNTVALPTRVLEYSSRPLPVTTNELDWLPKDTVFARRRYFSLARDVAPLDVSIVLMGRDRTSIHKPQICLTGQGWRIEKSEALTIPMAKPHRYDLPVMKLTAAKEARDQNGQVVSLRAVFVYWFVSENHLTAQHRERVWWMARDLFATGVLQRWAYVAFLSICVPGQEDATYARIREFIAASVPEFQRVSGPALASTAAPLFLAQERPAEPRRRAARGTHLTFFQPHATSLSGARTFLSAFGHGQPQADRKVRAPEKCEGRTGRAASSSSISPSLPSDGGEGWGEEARFYWFPLSSVLSPLVPRRERMQSLMQPRRTGPRPRMMFTCRGFRI